MNIKELKEPIEIKLEQYKCEKCEKKSYVNSEDKIESWGFCPFCAGKTKRVRIFDIKINGIGEY